MTLLEVIHALELVAGSQPAVGMVVQNDVFRLNTCPSVRYGVFAWTQGTHQLSDDGNLMRYAFTLFYVDRLTENQSNQVEVQSVGVSVLSNIIRVLGDRGVYSEGVTFQTFNQRFLDECAGVFANVTFEVPATAVCADVFGDFNDDFNDDFYKY